ncbi:response regulator, partial [Myxococcota bacterium]|nr:response regulator [Myxococcota bacterium]
MTQTQLSEAEAFRAFYESRLAERVVLYVDDEKANREVFELTLGAEFEVVTAATAEEALRILSERRVTVIVSDQRMPGITGVELLGRVARLYPEIPRILVTAYSDRETAIDAINRAGVVGYIAKPWHVDEVRMQLMQAIGSAHLRLAIGWLREETQRRERQAALAASRGEVLHDLANVHLALEGVRYGFEQLVERVADRLTPEELAQAREDLELFKDTTEHVSELHALTRERAFVRASYQERCRVSEILSTVVELVRAGRVPGVRFIVSCPEELSCWVDRLDVSRVLVNLLTNAVQAIEDAGRTEGEIRLTVVRDGGLVKIEVADDGPGIPAELRPRIFEP